MLGFSLLSCAGIPYFLERPEPIIKEMVSRSPLLDPFQLWLIVFCRSVGWSFPLPWQLIEMLRRNFRCYLHSLMNEEANNHLVATCLKEAPTKVIGGVRAWEELNGCKLIERFGRKKMSRLNRWRTRLHRQTSKNSLKQQSQIQSRPKLQLRKPLMPRDKNGKLS